LIDPIEGQKIGFSSIYYTWCNAQNDAKCIYYQLDRFYLNEDHFILDPLRDGCKVEVHPYTLSNHHPIKIRAIIKNGHVKTKKNEGFLLNTELL
jgi:hypothetical protein